MRIIIMVLLTIVNGKKLLDNSPQIFKHTIEKNYNEDRYRGKYQLPVDFKHLTKYGYGDGDFKQPFDGLRLKMLKPRDETHAMELIQNTGNKNIYLIPKKEPQVFRSPRDEMIYYRNAYNATDKTVNRPFDFSSILEKNFADPFASRRSKLFDSKNRKFPKADKVTSRKVVNLTEYFQENRFYRKPDPSSVGINWTSCDEFARNAVFHPDDIVNTKWLPFFIWSTRQCLTTVIHTFSYPTKKSVQYFKTIFGSHYININWRQPKLLLTERRNILLIAADRTGLFYGIPDQELSANFSMKNVILPHIRVRLKIHDPYIAMMYCDEQYAAIMAELGTEPTSNREAHLEAATLKFKGSGIPVHRDIEEEKRMSSLKQNRKMEDYVNKYIRIYKHTGDVDIKVKHA